MKEDLKVGETYDVAHSRKGDFRLRITSLTDEWATGEIVSGVATNISRSNEDDAVGEEIIIRLSHATFKR